MEFRLTKASDLFFETYVTIDTLKDLQELYDKFDANLIIDFEDKTIRIYDDYIE